jgi:hypothetical protein
MKTAVTWFEIPVANFDRAVSFYERVLDTKLKFQDIQGFRMAVFSYEDPGVGGSLTSGAGYEPGAGGAIVYLPVAGMMDAVLQRAQKQGGKVIMPKTKLNDQVGYIAQIVDCEGNRVGLHDPVI